MAVEARLYVAKVEKWAGQQQAGYAPPAPRGIVTMRHVTRGESNKAWASATPDATFTLTVNGDAFPWFEERLGRELRIVIDDRPESETTPEGG